jgi:hypothetical protein
MRVFAQIQQNQEFRKRSQKKSKVLTLFHPLCYLKKKSILSLSLFVTPFFFHGTKIHGASSQEVVNFNTHIIDSRKDKQPWTTNVLT